MYCIKDISWHYKLYGIILVYIYCIHVHFVQCKKDATFCAPAFSVQNILRETSRTGTNISKIQQIIVANCWFTFQVCWFCEHEIKYRIHVGHLNSSAVQKDYGAYRFIWITTETCMSKIFVIQGIKNSLKFPISYNGKIFN